MADTVEMQDIKGLDIDKMVKGFALTNYIFKSYCTVSSMSGDSIRWYQETAADLTATAPSQVANISPLSLFPTLEVSWTRNTSYPRKYAAEGFISMEDIKSADIDVLARTLLRLTRAVVKQVDTRIWNVITESQSPSNINSTTTTSVGGDQWDAASGQNPVKDILDAVRQIAVNNYDISNAVLFVSPLDYMSLLSYVYAQGAQTQGVANTVLTGGALTQIAGCRIVVSNNVTADYAAVVIPQVACTWKTHTDTSSRVIEDAGIGSKIRVWEIGEAILTDPSAVTLIIDTQT